MEVTDRFLFEVTEQLEKVCHKFISGMMAFWPLPDTEIYAWCEHICSNIKPMNEHTLLQALIATRSTESCQIRAEQIMSKLPGRNSLGLWPDFLKQVNKDSIYAGLEGRRNVSDNELQKFSSNLLLLMKLEKNNHVYCPYLFSGLWELRKRFASVQEEFDALIPLLNPPLTI